MRYFAGARAAAGIVEEQADAADVPALIGLLQERHGERLARVLAASSLLIDGVANTDRSAVLTDGSTVEVLPPFAGG